MPLHWSPWQEEILALTPAHSNEIAHQLKRLGIDVQALMQEFELRLYIEQNPGLYFHQDRGS